MPDLNTVILQVFQYFSKFKKAAFSHNKRFLFNPCMVEESNKKDSIKSLSSSFTL